MPVHDRRTRSRSAAWLGCAAALLVFCLTACGQREPPKTPANLPTAMPSEEEAARARADARNAVPLLPQGERDLSGQDLLGPADSASVAGVMSPDGEQRYGYRIQLFATADGRLAQQRAAEYRDLFAEAIYVRQEGVLYKVQVGDCISRDEAEALRRRARALGYEGAFIVDALVAVD